VTLPRFKPTPRDEPRVYQASDPTCVCGSLGARDEATDLCRECWRACVLAPAWEFRVALEAEPPAPKDRIDMSKGQGTK
jgi:hypothetical protein